MKSYEGLITPLYLLLNNQSYEGLSVWKKKLQQYQQWKIYYI